MPTKLYVGNIPYSYKHDDLERTFSAFGVLASLQLKQGFGFVEYAEYEDAQAAIREMHDKEIEGRRIKVEESRTVTKFSRDEPSRGTRDFRDRSPGRDGGSRGHVGGEKPESRHLFVANIPLNLTSSEIERYFERFGKVENTKLLPPKGGGHALSGFVDFCEVESARRAHNSVIVMEGQTIRTDYNQRQSRPRRDFDRSEDSRYDRDSGVARGDRYRSDMPIRDSGRGYESRDGGYRRDAPRESARGYSGGKSTGYDSRDAPRDAYSGSRDSNRRSPVRDYDSNRGGREPYGGRPPHRQDYQRDNLPNGRAPSPGRGGREYRRDAPSTGSRGYERPPYDDYDTGREPARNGRDGYNRSPYSSRGGRDPYPPRDTRSRGYSNDRTYRGGASERSPPSDRVDREEPNARAYRAGGRDNSSSRGGRDYREPNNRRDQSPYRRDSRPYNETARSGRDSPRREFSRRPSASQDDNYASSGEIADASPDAPLSSRDNYGAAPAAGEDATAYSDSPIKDHRNRSLSPARGVSRSRSRSRSRSPLE